MPIDALELSPQTIKNAYDSRSKIYAKLVTPLEFEYHLQAIDLAAIQPHETILEVATGPGRTLLELVKQVDKSQTVYGVDISPQMLALAEEHVNSAGYANIDLQEADARQLPFEDNTFDLLYNAYMLDLIPFADIPAIMREFRRVLKPGGRLVLLNMSKENATERLTFREKLYLRLPAKWVLYLGGACRPVLMEKATEKAEFTQVKRKYLAGRMPSEIVTAIK